MNTTRTSRLALTATLASLGMLASFGVYADEPYPVVNNTPYEIDGIYFFTATPQLPVLNWISGTAPIPAGSEGEMDPLVECSFHLVLTSGDKTALIPNFSLCDYPEKFVIPEDAFGQ